VDLTVIDRSRYLNDVRRALQQFLRYYLTADHASLFARWHRVEVTFTYPELPPEGRLKAPRIVIEEPRDDVDKTFAASGQALHYGEWHSLTLELRIVTDENTGGTLTGTDLAGAIALTLADHASDLETIGICLQSCVSEPGTANPATGLNEKTVLVVLELQVVGQAMRTLELELGRWTFTATGAGTFVAGLTLTTPQKLRLLLRTGTGTNASAVSVAALNQDGVSRHLSGLIPATRSGGTYVALVDEDPADSYSQVTSISVTPGSGLPGECFAVNNIPEELGGS
jgi:hypothetical protein